MTNPDDIQRDLEALLAAAAPSPAFSNAVREAIACRAAQWQRRLVTGAWAMGTSTVMAAVLVGVVAVRSQTVRVQPRSSAPMASAGPSFAPSVAPAGAVVAIVPPTSAWHQRTHAAGTAETVSTVSTEVLVPDDERLALVHLLQGLKEDRASVPPTLGPRFDENGKLLPPEPVVIEPLPELARPESDSSIRTVKAGTSGGANR
jgi:hypothetical protein